MKTLISGLFLAVLLSLLPTSLFAQTGDGETPAEEEVCDFLAGGPSALFGLCNAYCEAKDCDSYEQGYEPHSCNILFSNYEDRRDRYGLAEDPAFDMPCLDPVEPPPEPSCPCWSSEGEGNELDKGGDGLPTLQCFLNFPVLEDPSQTNPPPQIGALEVLTYGDGTDGIAFALWTYFAGGGDCLYQNTRDLPDEEPTPNHTRTVLGISTESAEACLDDILERSADWDVDEDNDGVPDDTDCIVFQ